MERTVLFFTIFVACLLSLITAAPTSLNDDNTSNNEDILPLFTNQNADYNVMMSNFKDFFMYLPVMFTTFRETMSGFPKLAEGIRILTSPNLEISSDESNECNCKRKSMLDNNEIDKSSTHLF